MRIVIKLGTSTLAHKTGRINIRRVEELCKVMSDLKNAGNEMEVFEENLPSKFESIKQKQDEMTEKIKGVSDNVEKLNQFIKK